MNNLQSYNFTEQEGNLCMNMARDALHKYTKEGQRLDVGSVDDILNKRGGVLIQIESSNGFGKLRGNAAIYDGRRIIDAIIDAVIHAASSRSIGSEIHRSEVDDLIIKLSLMEQVTLTKEPTEELTIGESCFIVPNGSGTWLYPTIPNKNNWSTEEYINRTFRSSRLNKNEWKDKHVAVVKTKSFIEQNPNGMAILDN